MRLDVKNMLPIIGAILIVSLMVSCAQQPSADGPVQIPDTGGVANPPAASGQPTVKAAETALGMVLVDSNGMTLYDFRADSDGISTCYNQCATAWPPLLIEEGQTPTGDGITAALGVTERTDGTFQVTANGMPLYYFFRDTSPGDTNGQGSTGAGALWYVLSPSGEEIRTPLALASGQAVKVSNTGLGNILVGNNGMTLYMFEADTGGRSTCYGQCAAAWPPLLIKEGLQPVGTDTTAALGVTERTDGIFQVTANGMPLYYFFRDSSPGDTNGQGSTGGGALWYVLSPSGTKIIATVEEITAAADRFSFFVTSIGTGNGANLGGLAGADAHCEDLAASVGAGDKTWKAYLSTASVDARDRIGDGPWYNVQGVQIAADIDNLHGDNKITKETALSEKGQVINGRGDTPNRHDILTGSALDGRKITSVNDTTCSDWTSSSEGSARVGHHDRVGIDEAGISWNSAHDSRGCSQENLQSTGGDGLFYCFAID